MSDYGSILLPSADQLRLIGDLWLVQPPLDEAWQEEIAKRSAKLDSGAVQTVAWEVVRDAALGRLGY